MPLFEDGQCGHLSVQWSTPVYSPTTIIFISVLFLCCIRCLNRWSCVCVVLG